MNIFILHLIPSICAQYHNDKHVVKMILETAQILSSVHHMLKSDYIPKYKLSHKNHPCNIWARQSIGNYLWLSELGLELCKEYTHRYGKIHATQEVLEDLQDNLPKISTIKMTPFAQAMPNEYKEEDAVSAYRHYYFFEKSHIADWRKRGKPEWWSEFTV